MVDQGFSTPFELRRPTFDHLKMQLDWLFCRRLRPSRSAIQPLAFSDHHAIWAEFGAVPHLRKGHEAARLPHRSFRRTNAVIGSWYQMQ